MGVTMFDFLSDKLGYHTKLYVILPGCVNQGKKPAALCDVIAAKRRSPKKNDALF